MYSPRFGFAYRPKPKFFKETVIRGGYGINYNTGQYATIARQLANQQPFAVTQTNIAGQQGCGTLAQFTLAGAFNCSNAAGAEQLQRESELSAGACADLGPGHPEDAAAGDRREHWL